MANLQQSGGGGGNSSSTLPLFANYIFSVTAGVVSAMNCSTGVVDYSGADAAVVINSVLGQLVSTGGTLYFKNGTYPLASATQETVSTYTHWYCVGIPSTNTENYPQFNFIGESGDFTNFVGTLSVGTTPTVNGVLFKVTTAAETAAGAGTLAAFWMRPASSFLIGGDRWSASVFFENLSVQFPNNQRGNEIHFYMLEAAYASFKNTLADYTTPHSLVSAAGNTAYVSPGSPSDGVYMRNCYTQGADVGIEVNTEHSHLETVSPFQCTTGFWYGRNKSLNGSNIFHPGEWIHIIPYDCINQIHIGPNVQTGAMLNIYGYDLEYTLVGSWAHVTGIVESTSGISTGSISYSEVQTGNGITNKFPIFSTGGTQYNILYGGMLNGPLLWNNPNTVGAPGVADTGISRFTPGVLYVGNGSQSDQSGTLGCVQVQTNTTQLLLKQTGDSLGTSQLALRNRSGSAGAILINSGLDLADMGFQTSTSNQFNLRYEHRSANVLTGNTTGEFQLINSTNPASTLGVAEIGDHVAAFVAPVLAVGATAVTNSICTLDTGISRTGAGALAIGNGTASDVSGSVALTKTTYQSANGGQWIQGQASELLTLSTSGLTTLTAATLLPANAIIESVVCRVTTTITTTTNWAVGDATTTSRFSSANATLVAGTTSVGLNHWSGAVTTLAAGPSQAATAKVQITCTGSNPGAGAIRITVFYRQFVAPTS